MSLGSSTAHALSIATATAYTCGGFHSLTISTAAMTSPHKILHLISDLDGYGLCRQMELLVESQFRLCKPVKILALRGDRKLARLLRQHGYPIQLLNRRWVRDPFVAARLVAELRRREYDLLHVWGQAAADYVEAVQRLVPQVPRVTTLSDDKLLVGISVPPSVKKSREEFCAELDLPKDAKLIAVAGQLLRSQQVDEAIWHFELVRTLDEKVRLLIFGDGPDRHRLERFTRLTSEPEAVRFLGYRRNRPSVAAPRRHLLAHGRGGRSDTAEPP